MSSYNRIGTTWSGTHKGLLTNVLRGEWGFEGAVMTDAAVGGFMGANGNTDTVAAAVCAGQDIWLGDQREAGFGGNENNPVVARAIRQAAKNNLYSQLRSSAMNGMKSGTRIVEITPWWQTALLAAEIVSGIVTGLCIAMAAYSFAVVGRSKKEENVNEQKN